MGSVRHFCLGVVVFARKLGRQRPICALARLGTLAQMEGSVRWAAGEASWTSSEMIMQLVAATVQEGIVDYSN